MKEEWLQYVETTLRSQGLSLKDVDVAHDGTGYLAHRSEWAIPNMVMSYYEFQRLQQAVGQ